MSRFIPALYLLLATAALAQNPPLPPAPPVPPRPVPAPLASPLPGLPGGANEKVRLQLTELKATLDFYERLTKKRLVYDAQALAPMPLTISVAGEVTREEAIRIIEISLILNGITLVPAERSDIVKVIGVGKNPRSAGIPIISNEAAIPDGEQVVTYLVKLEYVDPTELTAVLGTFVVQSQGQYTNITALPKSQSILITENTAVLRNLLRIIREIDIRPADVVSEFLTLERADAKDVLEKLTAIFEKQPAAAAGAPAGAAPPRGVQVPRPPATTPDGTPLPPGATAEVTSPNSIEIRGGALSEDALIVGKIKLTADVRTNRIHVVTRPVNLAFIRKLIQEFDSSVPFGEPISRPLKFISAGDVIDVVVKAITEPGMKEDTSTTGGTTGTRTGQTGGNVGRIGGGGGLTGGANNGSGSGGGLNISDGLEVDLVDAKPDARIVGTTKLIADKNANAIIIIGNADVRAKVFKLLDQLDRRIPQVMLHAVIGELNHSQKVQFGVDYIIRNAGLGLTPIVLNPGTVTGGTTTGGTIDGGTTGTGTTVTGTPTTPGQTSTNLVSFSGTQPVLDLNNLLKQDTVTQIAAAGGSGLTGYFTAGNSLTAVVTALEDSGRFHVINRPSVFTRNNKKAIIASGQEIAVPTSTISSGATVNNNGLAQQTNIQYKNVTLQLEVVPLINSDKEVSLDILQSNNEISGFTTIDNNQIPTIATRYVRTSVTVPNEATLILGGLIKTSTNRTKTGIPFLSNIPVLGLLFSNTSKEKVRNELVILIRPTVTWAPPDAIALRERENEFLNLPPDLESTIYPTVAKKKAAPEVMMRKPAVPLREKSTPVPKQKRQ